MKRKLKWKAGSFYYIFYISFLIVTVVLLVNLGNYIIGRDYNTSILVKCTSTFAGFCIAILFFRRTTQVVTEIVLKWGAEGLKNALSDKRIRRKVENATQTAIQFGVKNGIKKLEKLLEEVSDYDSKAVICFVMGMLYNCVENEQQARKYFEYVLQYRPYFGVGIENINEWSRQFDN